MNPIGPMEGGTVDNVSQLTAVGVPGSPAVRVPAPVDGDDNPPTSAPPMRLSTVTSAPTGRRATVTAVDDHRGRTDVDDKGLARLRFVADPTEVWSSVSEDFTPWLAQNLDVLGDALGVRLAPVATDVVVDRYRLDIQARDDDGRVVIVVNQLNGTDLARLGECLLCAAGLEASAVVWVCPELGDDFRRAFDWLNDRTDHGISFFGVEVGVVQIGDVGPRAPVFDVVSRPNAWAKDLRTRQAQQVEAVAESALNRARQDLFGEILAAVAMSRPEVELPERNADSSWITFADGPFGNWGLAQVGDGRIRVEARLDSGDAARNTSLFDLLDGKRDTWAHNLGSDLGFERMDGRQTCRIAIHHPPVDLLTLADDDREALVVWGVRTLVAMYDALDGTLRARAKLLEDTSARRR